MDNSISQDDIKKADEAGIDDLRKLLLQLRDVMKAGNITCYGLLIGKPVMVTDRGERMVTLFDFAGDTSFTHLMMLKSLGDQAGLIHQRVSQMAERINVLEAALDMANGESKDMPAVFRVPGKDIIQ